MSKSYINVYQSSASIITHLYIEDGIFKEEKVKFKPFLGVHALGRENTSWTDIYGKPVKIKVFDSIPDMKNWKKENNVGLDILGDISPVNQFIATTYRKDIKIQKEGLKIWNFDIEVYSDSGFPHANLAQHPVNAITIHEINSDTYQVFSLKDYTDERKNVNYTKCSSENDLLNKFLDFFQQEKPAILTGWNINLFDIPYLVNRINRILEPNDVKKMSRDGIIKQHEQTTSNGKKQIFYTLQGHIIWDYMELYKKYQQEPRERYSLSYISQYELGKDKIDYSEFENLSNLYKLDFQKFIKYNINDTSLVAELDKKLGYIDLALSIMYKVKCIPDVIFGTVQPWDCLIYNELLSRKILCPPNKTTFKDEYPGGYVKNPIKGLHEWVMVFDIVSSYPNQIRSFNLSPETIISDLETPEELKKVAKYLSFIKHESDTNKDICPTENLEEIEKYSKLFEKYNVCFTANGHFFKKNVEGIIPSIYSRLFNDRLEYKKIAKIKKKEYQKTKDKNTKHEYEQAELYSYTLKIILNSGYGNLANVYSRYYDIRIAEAITTNGQTCVRGVANYLEKKYPMISNVYSDTDSQMLNVSEIVKQRFKDKKVDKKAILEFLLKFSQQIIEPNINEFFNRLAKAMNMRELTIKMEPECIADTSIHIAKKRYIMSKLWDEGIFYIDKPKLKIRGVEIVRTSTPEIVRDKLKEAVDLIFETKDNDKLIEFVDNFKNEFFNSKFEQIAFPRSVTFSNYTLQTKGLPIGVRAAFVYNKFIKDNNLQDKYSLISDGDKIKFCLIKEPNLLQSNVVGIPSKLPEELEKIINIDYNEQFKKTFLAPLESIFNTIDWSYERKSSLLDFF